MKRIPHTIFFILLLLGISFSFAARAADDGKQKNVDPIAEYMRLDTLMVREIMETKISPWLKNPELIAAIKDQNERYGALATTRIEQMDRKWVVERNRKEHPFIDTVLESESSQLLRQMVEEGKGLFTEAFTMDKRGLIVSTTNITNDYWKGDEDKWRKTYLAGSKAVHISDVYYDDSAKAFQVQVSASISEENEAIGVLSVGINVEEMR